MSRRRAGYSEKREDRHDTIVSDESVMTIEKKPSERFYISTLDNVNGLFPDIRQRLPSKIVTERCVRGGRRRKCLRLNSSNATRMQEKDIPRFDHDRSEGEM